MTKKKKKPCWKVLSALNLSTEDRYHVCLELKAGKNASTRIILPVYVPDCPEGITQRNVMLSLNGMVVHSDEFTIKDKTITYVDNFAKDDVVYVVIIKNIAQDDGTLNIKDCISIAPFDNLTCAHKLIEGEIALFKQDGGVTILRPSPRDGGRFEVSIIELEGALLELIFHEIKEWMSQQRYEIYDQCLAKSFKDMCKSLKGYELPEGISMFIELIATPEVQEANMLKVRLTFSISGGSHLHWMFTLRPGSTSIEANYVGSVW